MVLFATKLYLYLLQQLKLFAETLQQLLKDLKPLHTYGPPTQVSSFVG